MISAAAAGDRQTLRALSEIENLLVSSPELAAQLRTFDPDRVVLEEGVPNHALFIILEGSLVLLKTLSDGSRVEVSRHRRGELIGVNSFATDTPSFCTAVTAEPTRVLKFGPTLLESLPTSFPKMHRIVQKLIVANLASRYRTAVSLQLDLAASNRALTETRNRLVHQEKLATLGQLAAGVAHEVNNPIAAIQRHRDTLSTLLSDLLAGPLPDGVPDFWAAGIQARGSLSEQRQVMEHLAGSFPNQPRALLRRVSALPEVLRERVLYRSKIDGEKLLATFECAFLLNHLGSCADQIADLVAKLKDYARPASLAPEPVDIRESIENSFVVLNPMLRKCELISELPAGLIVHARPTSLTQIWTNLIKNACEAMGDGGILRVTAAAEGDWIAVEIADNGPGIPDEIRSRIFDVNFTTKTGGEHFGLGLGLSITKSLIEENNGRLALRETPGGGSTFEIRLPRPVKS